MVNLCQGDIISLNFDPQAGHEQKGRRPAIVLSNNTLNHHSAVALVCPITNTNKRHPFHVPLDQRTRTTGVILCDQAKMLDMDARQASFLERAPEEVWREARNIIQSFL